MLLALSIAALACAAIPAALTLANLREYTPPPPPAPGLPPVTVIIPARNEAANIRSAAESVLASTGVTLELLILDDHSTDATAEIVRGISHPNLRLLASAPLPSGWNGKQHACWQAAQAATHPTLCFLDADVRLHPEALARSATLLSQSKAALVSGFPRQLTITPLEWLLLPLIHFVLLGLLPMRQLRTTTRPSFAAGCGQFFLVDRAAYRHAGGHAAIRTTMHDGLLLPRLFRTHYYSTRLTDLTDLATCRMYHSSAQVWSGLGKNATEGLAAPRTIVPITALLALGQTAPVILLATALILHAHRSTWIAAAALTLSYLPRLINGLRYRQSWRSTLLHPLGIVALLALQWTALIQKLRGRKATWKDRPYATT